MRASGRSRALSPFLRPCRTSYPQVDRGRAVVGKFWQMFMYDPVVLLYILFLVFNIIWLAFTQSALSSARYERCCDASPALCSVTLAVFVIEILFFILAPCVLAFSLLSECCNAAEGERKEEARRRQEAKHAQRSASQPMGMRVLSSLPIVGCIFAPQQRSTPPPARGAGYGAHSTGAAHGGSRLPHAEAVPVRRPAPEVMARPASSQPPAAQHGPPYAQAAYSPPAAAYSASAQPAYVQPACAYAEPAHVRAEPASGSCTSSAYCSAEASTAPPHYYGVQPSAVASAPPPPQYSAAPARPQQQPAEEESTSVLLGKLAGKAVKGVAAGAAAGVNAVNAARNKGAHGTHSATQGQGVHGAGGHTSEGAATARQL